MAFIIHFELENGWEDSFVIEGETIEEIREKANYELKIRGGKNPWSERIQ